MMRGFLLFSPLLHHIFSGCDRGTWHMVQLRFVFYCDCHVNMVRVSFCWAPSWEVSDKTSQNDETAVGDCSLYGDGLQPAGGPLQHNCRYVILQ